MRMRMMMLLRALVAIAASVGMGHAFLPVSTGGSGLRSSVGATGSFVSSKGPLVVGRQPKPVEPRTRGYPRLAAASEASINAQPSAANAQANASAVVVLALEKPLGIVLEEVMENQPRGVFVQSVLESGSAWPFREQIEGRAVQAVQGRDVTRCRFEQVMDAVAGAPSPVSIEFVAHKDENDEGKEGNERPVGTPVALTVLPGSGGGPPVTLQAKEGDNLRKVLLDGGVEVYAGFQHMGNCGGAGQCGMCAFDLIADGSEGWMERSDYEDKKLRRYPQARLSCLNSIQGPATIRKTKP